MPQIDFISTSNVTQSVSKSFCSGGIDVLTAQGGPAGGGRCGGKLAFRCKDGPCYREHSISDTSPLAAKGTEHAGYRLFKKTGRAVDRRIVRGLLLIHDALETRRYDKNHVEYLVEIFHSGILISSA